MKTKHVIFLSTVALLCIGATVYWNQYPAVNRFQPTDTFMLGNSTTNNRITGANVLAQTGTNAAWIATNGFGSAAWKSASQFQPANGNLTNWATFTTNTFSTPSMVANQIAASNLLTASQVASQLILSNYTTPPRVALQIAASNLVTAAQVAAQIISSNLMASASNTPSIGNMLFATGPTSWKWDTAPSGGGGTGGVHVAISGTLLTGITNGPQDLVTLSAKDQTNGYPWGVLYDAAGRAQLATNGYPWTVLSDPTGTAQAATNGTVFRAERVGSGVTNAWQVDALAAAQSKTNGYPWGTLYQPATANGTNWSLVPTNSVARTNIATSIQTGLLNSNDWSSFNAKQSALGFTPLTPTATTNLIGDTVTNLTVALVDNLTAPSAISPTGSAFFYTNKSSYLEAIYVGGGAVTDITLIGVSTGMTNGSLFIQTNEWIKITYGVAPTITHKALFR